LIDIGNVIFHVINPYNIAKNFEKLRQLNRVLQMTDDRLTKSVHQWKPNEKRSRGRPNKRWMDCIEEDLWWAGVTKCGKTAGRQRMTLNDIVADKQL